ncbi:unnamed protein product [Ophioblennius macclurei]
MRPSSRRRAAAWLLALPLGRGGEECARRGRLEMISFWLLCWKLLRATAGLRRTTPELTDGNQDDDASDNPADNPPTRPADPVTMEISSSPPLTDLERDNFFSYQIQDQPDVQGAGKEAADGEYGKGDECDYLVFEIGEEKGAARGAEGEGGDEGRGEIEGQDEGRGEIDGEEEGRGETEGEDEGQREMETSDEDRGRVEGEDEKRGEAKTEDLGKREIEGEDGGQGGTGEAWIEGAVKEEKDDNVTDLLFDSDSLLCRPSVEASASSSSLQEPWGHDLLCADDLSDCLQAELAMVYSDSEAGEDQWAGFPPGDAASKEEGGEKEAGKEEEVHVETSEEEQMEAELEQEERREGGKEDEERMKAGRDAFPRSPSVSSTASSTDPDRKFPVDFCVHQEMRSENVSTEHVDFMVARKQWKKMEAEVKGHPMPKPGLRAQGSFQGTHSSLYPPTRSPRLKHRDVQPSTAREPPLSSTLSPSSEDSGLDDPSYRSPPEEPETAVEREIRLTLEREEQHRRERGRLAQGLTMPRPSTLQTGRSPPRPPACRTPTLSVSPSPSYSSSLPRSMYHELTANNVIILEPDSSGGATSRNRLLSTAMGGLSDWPANQDAPPANVIVVETSNLIIRSASEFCLSSGLVPAEPQESTFTSNPFFKLRSLSSQSLVEQEIRVVRQREEEWRRQREDMWKRRKEEQWKKGKERYDTVLVSPGLSESITFTVPEVPDRCVSSPSSPSRTRKMERSSLSCDHKLD